MPDGLNPSFLIVWFCLLGAPPVAIAAFVVTHRRFPVASRRLPILCALLIAAIAGLAVLDVSLNSTAANAIFLATAYFSYCFLAISAWRLRLLILRIPVLVVATLPVAAGYMLGTVGMLGLMFIAGDYTRPPLQTTEMAPDLECRVTGWGTAISDSGYTVHLYKRWPVVPFLEREVAHIVVNETNPLPELASATCEDALKASR